MDQKITNKEEYSVSVWRKAYPFHAQAITAKNEVGAYKHRPDQVKGAALSYVDAVIANPYLQQGLPVEFWHEVRFMVSIIEHGRYHPEKWEKHLETSEFYLKTSESFIEDADDCQ